MKFSDPLNPYNAYMQHKFVVVNEGPMVVYVMVPNILLGVGFNYSGLTKRFDELA